VTPSRRYATACPPAPPVQRVACPGRTARDRRRRSSPCTRTLASLCSTFKGSSPDEGGATVTSLANARRERKPRGGPRVAAHRAASSTNAVACWKPRHPKKPVMPTGGAGTGARVRRRPCKLGPPAGTRWATVYAALCTIGRRSFAAPGRNHRGLQRRSGPGDLGATVDAHPGLSTRAGMRAAQPRRALTTWRAFWNKMASQTWPCATCCYTVS